MITKTKGQKVKYANNLFNNMSNEEIDDFQLQLLKKQLKYVYRNSEFYREIFHNANVVPEDIKTLEDFRNLPIFMDKIVERESQKESRERLGHPFGLHLCCSPDDVELTSTTSGTSGTPTFTYTYTSEDLKFIEKYIHNMLEYGGIYSGDRLLFCHALGIYATTSNLFGVRSKGVLPIDVDVRAGSETILKYANLTNPNAAMMTPSLAEHLITKGKELGIDVKDIGLSALFTVGEIGIGIPEIKQKIEDAYGCRVYDFFGEAGFSCDSDEYHGIHCVAPDLFVFDDLVDPETKQPLEITNGVIGELIMTELSLKALPRVRYNSGDMFQVFTEECPSCGFQGKRIKMIGRSDDMLIVKGVNVYPTAIKEIISRFVPDITGEIRIVLDNPPPRIVPPLKIKMEYGSSLNKDYLNSLEDKVKNALHIEARFTPEIIWCKPGTLEKSMHKTSLFEKRYEV